MDDTLSPLALRGWAKPEGWNPRRPGRSKEKPPDAAFLLATVPRQEPGEPLAYGACALLPCLLAGAPPVDIRVFYPDNATAEEKDRLAAAAHACGLSAPLSRSQLVELLFKRCYKQRLPLVGFRLPPQLGRVAVAWAKAKNGGFSLILATRAARPGPRKRGERQRRPLLANGEVENGDRPRMIVRPLDGQRAEIHFSYRRESDSQDRAPDGNAGKTDDHYSFPGRFVDLATLATVHTAGERHPDPAAALVPLTTQAAAGHYDRPDDWFDALLREVDDLARLYLRLLDCHRQTPGSERLPVDKVYSAASYADALLQAVGLDLPLAHLDLPDEVHAKGMGAFFGADCGIAVRLTHVPVAYLDITGHYPVSAHLAGTFELLRATHLDRVEEDPAELDQLLAQITPEQLLIDTKLWRRLATTVCMVEPVNDLLAHRVPRGTNLQLKTAPLTSREPLPYLLADLANCQLRTGRHPRIDSAFSLRTRPRRRKRLRPLELPSGHRFDPRREDFFLVLAEERLRLKHDPALPLAERKRQAKLLKLITNAACFGLLCQINVEAAAGQIELTNLDGTTATKHVDAVEIPGRWIHPVAAAGLTATGRLLLQLASTLVEQAGSTVGSWDTDSLCATATQEGGHTPCRGGPTDHKNGRPAIPVAAHEAIRQAQQQLERLSPYNPDLRRGDEPLLLALEPENFDPKTGQRHQLHLHTAASKNYDLYTLHGTTGSLTIRKASEHGLGHLRTPGNPAHDNRNWISEGRKHLLERSLHLPTQQPAWWPQPALSVLTLNRPGELARLRRQTGLPLRPFSRIAIAHPLPQYARDPARTRRTPIAAFYDGFNPNTAGWFDLTTGISLRPRFLRSQTLEESDLIQGAAEVVLCDNVGSSLERNSTRPETKTLDSDGQPCRRNTTGLLTPAPTEATRLVLVGKETRNLERAGITEDPTHTVYTDTEREAWNKMFLPTLRALAPGRIPRGRPSRHERNQLAQQAGERARAALRERRGNSLGSSDEEACFLYLRTRDQSTCGCGCGCGETVSGRAQYVSPAHRTRAYRARRAEGR